VLIKEVRHTPDFTSNKYPYLLLVFTQHNFSETQTWMVSSNAFVLNFQNQLFCEKSNIHPTLVSFFGNSQRTAKQGLQTLNPNFSLEKEREQ